MSELRILFADGHEIADGHETVRRGLRSSWQLSCNFDQPGGAQVIEIISWHVSRTQRNFEPLGETNMSQHQINAALTGVRNNARRDSISNISGLFPAQPNDRLFRWVHVGIKQNVLPSHRFC